ncbi:serine hydrolase [Actinomadura hibisca]|uniref:serine hydrolase n=1 Tax=Actinomadura hibisca TaxID=68565 RepID=UPI00082FB275|nr:serine hydrolase [Actinomadura hibisca]
MAGVLTMGAMGPASAAPAQTSAVAEQLRSTMERLRFQEVLDTAPPSSALARTLVTVDKEATAAGQRSRLLAAAADAKPIVQQPQIDATVIELDSGGKPARSGTVLMSPQYKDGVVVPVDENLRTDAVRWRQWDDAGWYANNARGTVDIVPGRENAEYDFMSPYPASVLKLAVNFGVLRMVDQGKIRLTDTYDYNPTTISSLCGGATSRTVESYINDSLTWSSNGAACALVKLMHDHDYIGTLNQTFQDLGLETIQLKNTNPVNGGRWGNPVTMNSLDTAKLLVLVNGSAGTVWTAPNGDPVKPRAVLSETSRNVFKAKLGQQGFNDMLSSANRCSGTYPARGIPHAVGAPWLQADGTVNVNGSNFGADVRPCNTAAEVSFLHKTGWVNNSASDAGIVKFRGKGGRHYIITVFSNLGTQYVDADRPPLPGGVYPYSYTEKFAKLGAIIDAYEKESTPE